MTQITFTKYYDTYIFECKGHTGYASCGQDILCSAVSCLCYTLERYLTGAREKGLIESLRSDFEDGSVFISFEYADTAFPFFAEEAVRAIMDGFVLLSESFPDHISADI